MMNTKVKMALSEYRRIGWVCGIGLAALGVAVTGCAASVEEGSDDAGDPVQDLGSGKPGETVAPLGFLKPGEELPAETAEVQSAGVDNTYAVGVIPYDGTTCPVDSRLVSIFMDDEDDDNWSFHSWWDLPQTPREPLFGTNWQGTYMTWCKVDGQAFKPLTTDVNAKSRFYATLKLGTTCPNGSLDMWRRIDNEDDRNQNSAAGPISPNESQYSPSRTTLRFCFFRTGGSAGTMSSFPDLGIGYAVYHDYDGGQPSQFPAKGWIYSDDEDDDNTNAWPTGTSATADFGAIIGGGTNTMMDIGWVR